MEDVGGKWKTWTNQGGRQHLPPRAFGPTRAAELGHSASKNWIRGGEKVHGLASRPKDGAWVTRFLQPPIHPGGSGSSPTHIASQHKEATIGKEAHNVVPSLVEVVGQLLSVPTLGDDLLERRQHQSEVAAAMEHLPGKPLRSS